MAFVKSGDVALWLSLLTVLIAVTTMFLLPRHGPMRIAVKRSRMVTFAQLLGLGFALVYAGILLGFL